MSYFSSIPLYSFRPPLYPIFLFFIFSLFGKNTLVIRIIYVFINLLIAYLTYLIGKKIFNIQIALIALFIILFYLPLIYLSGWLGPETISILLLTLTVYLIYLTSENPSQKNLILLSFVIALLIYSRSFFLGLSPFLILSYFILLREKKITKTLQVVLFVILFLSPWLIRNFIIHKKIVFITEGGLGFYAANNPYVIKFGHSDYFYDPVTFDAGKLKEIERDAYLFKKGIEFIKTNFFEYLTLVRLRFLRIWRPYFEVIEPSVFTMKQHIIMLLTETPILLLFLVGLFFSLKDKRKFLPFYLIFFYFTVVGALIRAKVSYRMTYSSLIILTASYGIWKIYNLKIKKHV